MTQEATTESDFAPLMEALHKTYGEWLEKHAQVNALALEVMGKPVGEDSASAISFDMLLEVLWGPAGPTNGQRITFDLRLMARRIELLGELEKNILANRAAGEAAETPNPRERAALRLITEDAQPFPDAG